MLTVGADTAEAAVVEAHARAAMTAKVEFAPKTAGVQLPLLRVWSPQHSLHTAPAPMSPCLRQLAKLTSTAADDIARRAA